MSVSVRYLENNDSMKDIGMNVNYLFLLAALRACEWLLLYLHCHHQRRARKQEW